MTDKIKIHTDFRLRAAENGGWTVGGVSSADYFDTPIGAYTTAADMIHALSRMLGVDLDGAKTGPCKADPEPAFEFYVPDDLRVGVYRGTDRDIPIMKGPAPKVGMVRVGAGEVVDLPPGAVVTGVYQTGYGFEFTYQIPAA